MKIAQLYIIQAKVSFGGFYKGSVGEWNCILSIF